MAILRQPIAVSVPDLRAVLWSTDAPHTGMKETYSIARVESGRAEWWSRGKVWTSGPGSLVIQQPGDVHRDMAREGPMTFQIVTFSPAAVEPVIGQAHVQPHLAANDERGAAFRRLHEAVAAGAHRLPLEVAVAEAIRALGSIDHVDPTHTPPVRRAIDLLRTRLADPITLDDLEAHAGLDKFHLCRAFRAQVGMPPHAYLTRLRIMRSKELLAAGVKPIDVASRVGLYDQSQLNRHFRRIVGTTPGEYARSVTRGPMASARQAQ